MTHLLPDIEPHHAGLRAGLEDRAEDGQDGRGDEDPLPPELVAEDAEQDLACGVMLWRRFLFWVNGRYGLQNPIDTLTNLLVRPKLSSG